MAAPARITRAERKRQTRDELVAAAHDVFRERGFHASSLDLVAAEAGFTKGAVYSNFASKEDLFFAVYERRVDESRAWLEGMLREHAGLDGPVEAVRATLARQDPGWLAVFFEFWGHVLRHPELRERFAALHRRAREPLVQAAAQHLEMDGMTAAITPERWTLALYGMVSGIALEQLTDPGLDGEGLGVEMVELATAGLRATRRERT